MKRNIRYFIAAVQNFYMECTVKLMDMGKGYIHPEEYYVPVYLYPELFRKAAACNNMTWDMCTWYSCISGRDIKGLFIDR